MKNIAPTQFRLPAALKAQLKAAALENRRSMNAEVVKRLEASFGTSKERSVKALQNLLGLIDQAAALNQPANAPAPEIWIERILKASFSVRTALGWTNDQ